MFLGISRGGRRAQYKMRRSPRSGESRWCRACCFGVQWLLGSAVELVTGNLLCAATLFLDSGDPAQHRHSPSIGEEPKAKGGPLGTKGSGIQMGTGEGGRNLAARRGSRGEEMYMLGLPECTGLLGSGGPKLGDRTPDILPCLRAHLSCTCQKAVPHTTWNRVRGNQGNILGPVENSRIQL